MDLSFSAEDKAFQQEVRDWLRDNLTDDIKEQQARSPNGGLPRETQERWQKRLYAKGWMALNWPKEHGGPGLTRHQRYILELEFGRAGAPGVLAFGVTMVAPVIMKFGTQAQKEKYLPDILSSKTWWCQGYSEPGSGSDLASLRCKAEDKGDHFLVNGAKTWTTKAQNADMIFCLVRTSQEEKKQLGISFLLIDMTSPGVEVQPIVTLDGAPAPHQEVNTVFFEDVKVPKENLVGEMGQGWTCAKYLLEFERGNAHSPSLYASLATLREVAKAERDGHGQALAQDGEFRREMADLELQIQALEATELRILGALATGQNVGPESSLLKTRGTEIGQRLTEKLMETVGHYAHPRVFQAPFGGNEPPVGPDYAGTATMRYFNYRKASIYAGSNEIQRNIMAKLVLGL